MAFNPNNAGINTANNFGYDEIGNLTRDESEEIADIAWDNYGKIKGITRTSGSTKPDLLFIYTPTGERALKVEMTKNTDGSLTAASAWGFTAYMRDATGNVLNTMTGTGPSNLGSEYGLFGSSRLGVWSPNVPATYLDGVNARGDEYRLAGDKSYELTNHLGNVMVTVGDKKLGDDSNGDDKANSYHADLLSMNDYYAFGMAMDGRKYSPTNYRYGFNGKEKDDEVKNTSGTQYDYGFRIYDPRLGKFLSVDPLTKNYPMLTPYQFASNSPIFAIDLVGLEGTPYTDAPSPLNTPTCIIRKPTWDELIEGAQEKLIYTGHGTATFTDANDAAVIATTLSPGIDGTNIDGTKATGTDKAFAAAGAIIPFISGSAVKQGLKKLGNWALNLVGFGSKMVLKYGGYGGDILARSDKTTTVLGRWMDEVSGGGTSAIKQSGNYKYGENAGGINILDDASWTWEKNQKWLDDAMGRGDDIRLVSDPTNAKNVNQNGKDASEGFTTFGKEMEYMKSKGYVQDGE